MCKNPSVKEVVVVDVDRAMVPAAGVAADLSHMVDLDCASTCAVKSFAISTAPDGVSIVDVEMILLLFCVQCFFIVTEKP